MTIRTYWSNDERRFADYGDPIVADPARALRAGAHMTARSRRPLSLGEAALLAQVALALGVAAAAVALLPFRTIIAPIRERSRTEVRQAAEPDRARIEQIRWAVRAMARRVPWRAKCLEQALVSRWLLWRHGIAATLHYGVRRDGSGALEGHVWVSAGPFDVVGHENKADFAELARFPAVPDLR